MCPTGYYYCPKCEKKVSSSEVEKAACKDGVAMREIDKECHVACGVPVIWKSSVTMTGERHSNITLEPYVNLKAAQDEILRCFRVKAKRYADTDLSRFTDDELWKLIWEKAREIAKTKDEEHEDKDCGICVWGCKVKTTHYKDGTPTGEPEFSYGCSQDGRPKPCQRGLFKRKEEGMEWFRTQLFKSGILSVIQKALHNKTISDAEAKILITEILLHTKDR